MTIARRFIDYRRVIWVADQPDDLEQRLRFAWGELPEAVQRVTERRDGTSVMGFSLVDHGGAGVSIHCVRYTDGQGVGTIPMVARPDNLGETLPGDAENFLNQDFFMLVQANHVVTLNAARGAAMAREFCRDLMRLAGLPDVVGMFDLVQIANADAVRRIHEGGGVQSIQVDLAIEAASAAYLAEDLHRGGLIRAVRDGLASIVHSITHTESGEGLGESNRGTVRLQISVPDGDLEVAKEATSRIAEDIVEDETADDYVVYLRNGGQIRRNAMAVRKLVPLEKAANSFDPRDVRREMLVYLGELRASDQLRA
ncbi:hypothetical protein [Paracoccus sp. IB05]|uniref:hypothetical protein n=1 Tax=Paracoccus sp. IB05 TaxID=2779367 RepID=UPI0018E81330|nr:hypothetical protein [Paracoccus sp. IB05]MBJ2150596.1 hypothetical protein [Paracoccus sp. IB05]